jgi:hypothetical protein
MSFGKKYGWIHGRDIEHWCEAERIVISRMQPIGRRRTKNAKAPRKTPKKTASKSQRSIQKTRNSSGSAKET